MNHIQQLSLDRVRLELIMRQAGKLLMSYFQTSEVSQADGVVEAFLIEQLSQFVPQAYFYAEESGISGDEQSPYSWVIDPLDGTTNFVHGFPYFCISVALVDDTSPVLGIIYQPIADELFYAESGKGFWINGSQVLRRSSSTTTTMVAMSGYKRGGHLPYAIRYCGAAALDCAYTAAGRCDGLIAQNKAWWDIAAGIVLLTEAGLVITHRKEHVSSKRGHTIVAGAAELHTLLCDAAFYRGK